MFHSRSKSVPPVYRTYRIFDPKKRVKNEPEKTIIKSAKNRKQLNFKVMAKKQRTLTGKHYQRWLVE